MLDKGQEKGTGVGVLTIHVVPTVPRYGGAEAAVQEGEKEEVECGGWGGWVSDLQLQGQWRRVAHSTSWKCHTVRCQRAG